MIKFKRIKKERGISPKRLGELQRATLIASAGTSIRLAGSKLSDKEVERVINNALTKSRNIEIGRIF